MTDEMKSDAAAMATSSNTIRDNYVKKTDKTKAKTKANASANT